ncbi:NADH-quinone oxidoreductase subunit M [Thermodesulfobacterium sp.]|jgi:NADH-quinone oxidoreductase subunit M|uniref:NADH-quinone oxidoreductase subunit M n=1 Tax=Thermodesulfobacterium commune TaxID=1741 RepID=A0A101FJI9_9BACT|nr:NADH-quinone oxidoreductase subunit M [Thermodesulfobacterium sp.]KUJ97886.1 MAG: Proton-translocating NADH-quinone oxidoreductase, chain M [Thermodesulfobacterium sp. 37_54]KUK19591.1 MAG: Proton-translocating NADH-quinone oxidoreductase, chain M [Thermodesulfobacterium commune]KUK38188.1 MAG: Proton-translocating NADH-quinone oxidoreductase, chain M [Thermodesulfobacterium commune]MBZ4681554.1 NADH-quinone oxidoreductase subunit [Thermodesulfobacterium sp.]MDK2861422.1 NADH-quinone oxidor
MEFLQNNLLSLILWFPLLGALPIFFLGKNSAHTAKCIALLTMIIDFGLSLLLLFSFDFQNPGFQFVEKKVWIDFLNSYYFLGVDGISILFIPLTTLTTLLCITISWNSIKDKVKEFYLALLFTNIAIVGTLCALDLLLFYVFWEAMLIPMYLIIGIWGGPRRIYATLKFFLYTFFGSVFMLIAIVYLFIKFGTFDYTKLLGVVNGGLVEKLLFLGFALAFAIKIPMWPVHTWLPDAHTEAPTAGSVILAGILIKLGAYGFIRFALPMFPHAAQEFAPLLLLLSVIAIIYGGLACLAQDDLKRLIAYSSVSHMGFVTLGIFAFNPIAMKGAILQMINHGIVTGALFMCVGIVYDRTHSRAISYYGGLASVMPVYAAFFMIFTLASIGLPGTNGFIGEFLILLGTFFTNKLLVVFAALGLIIGAGYMLWLYQRVFFERVNPNIERLAPLRVNEFLSLLPMLVLVFLIGLYPKLFLDYMTTSIEHLLNNLRF